MTMLASTLQPAYVLHRRSYRETSLLVDLFTASHGRIGAVARGARRAKNGQASVLQPFVPLLASWRGRGELATLTGVEQDRRHTPLKGVRLASGFYLNELLVRLLHRHDPHPGLYWAYTETLNSLQTSQSPDGVLRLFEKRLLDELGYGLVTDVDADTGEPLVPTETYHYLPNHGPVRSARNPSAGISVLGHTLLALGTGEILARVHLIDAKHFMRRILACHLGDKPLASRSLLDTPL